MLSDKTLYQIVHAVSNKSTASLLLLGSRIFTFCSSSKYLQRHYASLMQRDATIRPNRVFAQTRSSATCAIEHNENLATIRSDFYAEAGTATIPVNDVPCRRRQLIDCALGQLHSRHRAFRLQMECYLDRK